MGGRDGGAINVFGENCMGTKKQHRDGPARTIVISSVSPVYLPPRRGPPLKADDPFPLSCHFPVNVEDTTEAQILTTP